VQRKPELIQSNDTIGMGWNTYTKLPQNIPNGWKIYQMATKYTNIFHCKNLQNLPEIEIFGLKINHLATLVLGAHGS
jgi:hypothetical protein